MLLTDWAAYVLRLAFWGEDAVSTLRDQAGWMQRVRYVIKLGGCSEYTT